jgi:hypothetical protein
VRRAALIQNLKPLVVMGFSMETKVVLIVEGLVMPVKNLAEKLPLMMV